MSAAGVTLMLEREVRRLDRRGGRRRLVRVFSLLLFAVFLGFAHGMGPFAPFMALVAAQMLLLLVLQPVRAAGIMVQARQEGTLPLLGVTPLRAWALHAGTIGASLALAAENMLVALPLVSVAAAYGGLTPGVVASAYATLAVGALLGSCIGAAVGARHGTGAFIRSLSWMLLYLLIPVAIAAACAAAGAPIPGWLLSSFQLSTILVAPDLFGALLAALCNLALAGGLFALGVWRLKQGVLSGALEAGGRGARKARRVPERRVVAWRERQRPSPKRWVRPGFIAVTLVIVLLGAQIGGLLTAGQTQAAAGSAFLLGWVLWLLMLGWGFLSGARSYSEDREDGSLVLLLTVMGRRRIVGEKLLGALQRGGWGVLGGSLVHGLALTAYLMLDNESLLTVAIAFGSVVVLWVGGTVHALALGQYLSIRAPSSARAQAWAAATAALVFFVGGVSTCTLLMPMIVMWGSTGGLQFLPYAAIGLGAQLPTAFLLTRIHKALGSGPPVHVAAAPVDSPAPIEESGQGGALD